MTETESGAARRWIGAFALGQGDEATTSGELNYDPQKGITILTTEWKEAEEFRQRHAERRYASLRGVIEGNRVCTVIDVFETKIGGAGYLESRHIVGNAILLDGWCKDPASPNFFRLRLASPALTAIANEIALIGERLRQSGVGQRSPARARRRAAAQPTYLCVRQQHGPVVRRPQNVNAEPLGGARDKSRAMSVGPSVSPDADRRCEADGEVRFHPDETVVAAIRNLSGVRLPPSA